MGSNKSPDSIVTTFRIVCQRLCGRRNIRIEMKKLFTTKLMGRILCKHINIRKTDFIKDDIYRDINSTRFR